MNVSETIRSIEKFNWQISSNFVNKLKRIFKNKGIIQYLLERIPHFYDILK